ncbi:GNAT family N-acetyltransferase [Undibacterium sp. JH2W]|uniref:GNAT family N-acetyltransferase n=1 Tax=Undibacterium sp. JH2W TaxID=3413037 RepID=UPI003BF2D26B
MTVLLRNMQADDLARVYRIQSQVYATEMVEAAELLANRLATAPACAWVAEQDQQLAAYLAAYPSLNGRISALGQDFQVAQPANALYLHDMAVAPEQAGKGLARTLLEFALTYARQQGWQYACLVSVQSTRAYWQRLGFLEQTELNQEQIAKLATYMGPAYYMSRRL